MKRTVITYGFMAALLVSFSGNNMQYKQAQNDSDKPSGSYKVSCYFISDDISPVHLCSGKKVKNIENVNCPSNFTVNQLLPLNNYYPEPRYTLSDNNRQAVKRLYSLLKI